jgi:hypothetical protein
MGALSGAAYGLLLEFVPAVGRSRGVGFGSALWLAADEAAVPLLGFAKGPKQYPLSSHAEGLGAHVVYGAVTDLVCRGIRSALR